MYVEENNDWLVPNNPPNYYPNGRRGPTWALGSGAMTKRRAKARGHVCQ